MYSRPPPASSSIQFGRPKVEPENQEAEAESARGFATKGLAAKGAGANPPPDALVAEGAAETVKVKA